MAQPDQSIKKVAIFTKWYITNQVDFRAPPVKSLPYVPVSGQEVTAQHH